MSEIEDVEDVKPPSPGRKRVPLDHLPPDAVEFDHSRWVDVPVEDAAAWDGRQWRPI